jgi:hypothetical protein
MDFPAITGSPLSRNRGEARCPSIRASPFSSLAPHTLASAAPTAATHSRSRMSIHARTRMMPTSSKNSILAVAQAHLERVAEWVEQPP